MSTYSKPNVKGNEACSVQTTTTKCFGPKKGCMPILSGGHLNSNDNSVGQQKTVEVVENASGYRIVEQGGYGDCDDEDNDVVVVKIKNGCDYARLEEDHIVSTLNKKLEHVHSPSSELTSKTVMTGSEARQIPVVSPSDNNCKQKTMKPQCNQKKPSTEGQTEIKGDVYQSNNDSLTKMVHQLNKFSINTYANDLPSTSFNACTTSSLKENQDSSHKVDVDQQVDNSKQRQSTFQKSLSLDLYNEEKGVSQSSQYLRSPLLPDITEHGPLISDSESKSSSNGNGIHHLNTTLTNSDGEHLDKSEEDVQVRSMQRPTVASKLQSLESRPIYPNVPYSPYASPYGSPRTNRRRPPLRESRRISIERSGSFLQLNQYKLMDQIGQGSYGLVKLAYSDEDSTHYAMKILSKRRLLRQAGLMRRGPKKATSPLDRVYREIAVLKKLDHPNVVKLVEVLDDPVEDALYMVFELVKQGEVLSIPTDKPLTEERAWSVFRDSLLGLEYLHYQKIIHADLKPGNLLLTECGHVKIADLGVCNEFMGENATMTNGSTAGTPAFRAPETLILGQNVYCGRAADIWSLGATLYSLVFGNVPFVASSIPLLYEKVKNEALEFPTTPKISDELRACITLMLDKNPSQRITLPDLKINPWVTAGGTCPLPSEAENCRLVQVDDEDINSVVRSIPKLDTLILIKTMLKKHSFGNPFLRGISGKAPQRGGSRLERFVRAGRSNSAPGSYHIIVDRQPSVDKLLPALTEHCSYHSNTDS